MATAASKAKKASPRWVIDLHGIKEALTTTQNSVRVAIIDAIEAGQMFILKPVSAELKDTYPGIYSTFQTIQNKKYMPISAASSAGAALLMEASGASPLGSIPVAARFEALAEARRSGCILVSAGKAHKECCAIANQNGFPSSSVIAASDFS